MSSQLSVLQEKLNNEINGTVSAGTSRINWKEYLHREDNIKELFATIGIDEYELINIKTKYVIDNRRHGLIVIVKNKNTGNLSQIIIDTISGEPRWSQLMDCTFDLGRDCEKRIILYDDAPGTGHIYDHDFDEWLGTSFVEFNNCYGVDTYLIKVSTSTDEDTGNVIKYEVEQRPDTNRKTISEDPPSKQDMEKVLFWIYEDYFSGWESHIVFEPEHWVWDHRIAEWESIQYEMDWNEHGAFIRITPDSPIKEIIWILENHSQEIHQILKDCEVKVNRVTEGNHEIVITLINKPFSDFIYATPEVKHGYIERLGLKERELLASYHEMISEMNEDQKKEGS